MDTERLKVSSSFPRSPASSHVLLLPGTRQALIIVMSLLFGSGKQLAPVSFSERSNPDGIVLLDQVLWDALSEDDEPTPTTSESEAVVKRLAVILEPAVGSSRELSSGLSKI